MKDVLTAAARVMALENGASFAAAPGVAYDRTDNRLGTLVRALLERLAPTGVDLLRVEREGSTLVAHVDEANADEPLCPAAFNRVIHRLSHELLGEVWEGKLVPPSTLAAVLVRVA